MNCLQRSSKRLQATYHAFVAVCSVMIALFIAPRPVLAYNIDGYPSYYDYMDDLQSLHNAHPDITDLVTVGYGQRGYGQAQGHAIKALKVSDNPDQDEDEPAVLFSGLHHPKEPISIEAVMRFLEHVLDNYGSDPDITAYVDGLEIWFLPILNPDGYLYLKAVARDYPYWRKNLRDNDSDGVIDYNYDGVDLNRNYPYNWSMSGSTYPGNEDYRGPWAGSESEVQVYMDLAQNERFLFSLTYHSYANTMDFCWGLDGWEIPETSMLNEYFSALAALIPAAGGGTLPLVGSDGTAGFSYNWMFARAGVLEGQVEIGDSFIPTYSTALYYADQQESSQLQLLDFALNGPGLRGHVFDQETGDPLEAVVRIIEYYTPLYMGPRMTDPQYGRFFRRTRNAVYDLEISAPGYAVELVEDVTVTGDQWTDLEIGLTRGVPAEYAEDFTGSPGGWSPDAGNWEILGGMLRHLSTYGEDRSSKYNEYSFADFSYQARVRIDDGDLAGLCFRGPTGGSNCYVFYLRRNEQNVRLVQKLGHETWIMDETSPGSGQINLDQWYLLRVEASGNHFDCYVDSELQLSVTDNSGVLYPGGKVGVWCSETRASFDDVLIEDRDVPASPSGLSAVPGAGKALLDWDDNGELDLDGYHVYHSLVSGGPYDTLTVEPVTDSRYLAGDLEDGSEQFFIVTAVDLGGQESYPSAEVSVITGGQPVLLVVEDDDRFSHEDYLHTSLVDGDYVYHTFDAEGENRSPTADELSPYELVIWFCGDDGVGNWFWDGGDVDNPAIVDYLDGGGALWTMGLDLLYDRYGGAPDVFIAGDFCYDYLGIAEYAVQSWSDDGGLGVEQLDLAEAMPGLSVDPIVWTTENEVLKYVDGCPTAPGAEAVYEMGPADYPLAGQPAAVLQPEAPLALSFFFNLRYVYPESARQQLVDEVLQWFHERTSPLSPVEDLVIQWNDTEALLSWSAVNGATGYEVRSDSDPYGTFSQTEAVLPAGQLQWTDPVGGSPPPGKFYIVIATR